MNLKARFKPRAEAGLLSKLVQDAWQDYQDRIASTERQAEVAERIARYFEYIVPTNELEILKKHGCVAWHDHCNVRVYDADTEDIAKYKEVFGIELPRKVPCIGAGGYGYPHITACEPAWGVSTPLRDLDPYFLGLLAMRRQYREEYKASTQWPADYGKANGGKYPTWGEIADKFPVLGEWLKKQDAGKLAQL